MFILDTDHVSLVSRVDSGAGARILTRVRQVVPKDVVTSVVTYEEQIRGWTAILATAKTTADLIDRYERLGATLKFFCRTTVLPFNEPAAVQLQRLRSLKVRIGTMDMKIAAIALANDATILTRNVTDFRLVPGLRIEDWTA